MAFVFVTMHPVGDKRGSYTVRKSDEVRDLDFRRKEDAMVQVKGMLEEYSSAFLVVYSHRDRPIEAWAYQRQQWRRLPMMVHRDNG